jgi:hypothetical protein
MSKAITEAGILERVVAPLEKALSPEAATGLLSLKFDDESTRTIRKLLRQNGRGTITSEDRLLLEKFLRIGQLIDLIHAKARLVLRKNKKSS